MKIYIIDKGELKLRYARLYFHGEPDVECVAAEFDEFLRSNPVQCIVSPANSYGLMDGGYAREEDLPEKTLFVITTDGMENASRKYSYEQLKAMIERQKKKYGWEFIFLGANIDAAKEAARFGIDEDRAVNYNADRKGTAVIYEAVSEAVCSVRACRPMTNDWRRRVDEDYKKRGK